MMKLEEFAEINMGQSPESSSYNENKDGLPFFQGKADFGKVSPEAKIWCNKPAKIAEKYDILMSVRAPVGDLNIANEKCCIGRGLAGIRANGDKCYYKYLYYFLKSKYRELNQMATGSTFKAISKNNILTIEGNIPEITEQKIIVDKLDKIQNLIDLEEKQIEDSNELIKSQFVEMFQSGIYPKEELGKLCDVRDGTHDSPKYLEESEYKFITSKNIVNNEIDFSEAKYITKQDYDKFNTRSKVNYGDILMPMIGTIGKPIIVNIPDEKIDFAIKNVALIKFLENSKVTNIYIKNLFDSDYFENAISQNKRGGTQKFIALSDIRKLEIEIPPIELQNKFADFVKQVDKQKLEIKKNIDELKKLEENLMNKYFN